MGSFHRRSTFPGGYAVVRNVGRDGCADEVVVLRDGQPPQFGAPATKDGRRIASCSRRSLVMIVSTSPYSRRIAHAPFQTLSLATIHVFASRRLSHECRRPSPPPCLHPTSATSAGTTGDNPQEPPSSRGAPTFTLPAQNSKHSSAHTHNDAGDPIAVRHPPACPPCAKPAMRLPTASRSPRA
jgi:hypothetical protein